MKNTFFAATEYDRSHSVLTALILVSGLAACSGELPELVQTTQTKIGTCNGTGCNNNSDKVDDRDASPSRSTRGASSPSGFETDGLMLGGVNHDYKIVQGKLIATDPNTGIKKSGAELIGGYILMSHGPDTYELHVDDYTLVPYWTRPSKSAHGYWLRWRILGSEDPKKELCTNQPGTHDPVWGGGLAKLAFFFSGEEYDDDSLSVVETGGTADDLYYTACAATILAKLTLQHYIPGLPETHEYATNAWERELLTRVYAAGYCYNDTTTVGDKLTKYTVAGEPLMIQDARGWMSVDTNSAEMVEAVWLADGTVCIEEPRREEEDGDVISRLEDDCGLPPTCTELNFHDPGDDGWIDDGTFRTLLPMVP